MKGQFSEIHMATDMKLLFDRKANVFRIFVQLRILMAALGCKKRNRKKKRNDSTTHLSDMQALEKKQKSDIFVVHYFRFTFFWATTFQAEVIPTVKTNTTDRRIITTFSNGQQ